MSGATDQLRRIHGVSTQILSRERIDDAYVVTARATDPSGRSDESIGAVSIGGLKGDALCNALMRAETKAKRRATLAFVGLGWLDESEVETIPSARRVPLEQLHPPEQPSRVAPPPALEEETPTGRSERMAAVVAEMDAAVADEALVFPEKTTTRSVGVQRSVGVSPPLVIADTPTTEPVTERTRMLCTGFRDAAMAQNPRVTISLPRDDAGEAAWRRWLAAMSTKLKVPIPNDPNATAGAAS